MWARRDSSHLIPGVVAHSIPPVPQGRQAGPGLPWLVIWPPWACWRGVLAHVNTALWRESPDLLLRCKYFHQSLFQAPKLKSPRSCGEMFMHIGLLQVHVNWVQHSTALSSACNIYLAAMAIITVKVGLFLGLSIYRMISIVVKLYILLQILKSHLFLEVLTSF